MANKKNRTNIKDERIEDVTMYGEFVAAFDQWMTPDRQRERAKHLEEVTEEIAPEEGVQKDFEADRQKADYSAAQKTDSSDKGKKKSK